MAKPTPDAPAAKVALYEKLLATQPEVERKGAKNPYTSRNGNMQSFLTKEGRLALRLPSGSREAFLKRYRTRLCEQYGVVMKEYVVVPDALLRRTRELARHFAESWDYVGSLKPKPTTRPKKTAKKTAKKTRAAGGRRIAKKA